MKLIRIGGFAIALMWSCRKIWTFISRGHLVAIFDSSMSIQEFSVLVHLVIVAFGLVVVFRFVTFWNHRGIIDATKSVFRLLTHRETFLVSALAFIPSTSEQPVVRDVGDEIPIQSMIQPMVAISLVRRLLRRHSEGGTGVTHLQRLTEECAQTVYQLRQFAVQSQNQGVVEANIGDDEIDAQLDALLAYEPAPVSSAEAWDIVLRLYGYPRVESRSGIQADFIKRRSVEVLAWLGMNMERPRRSAVRTALWDVEISDSSFSTVMSDIRRGLSSVIVEKNRSEIFPPTFTDTIDPGISLITDFDLLHQALVRFREDKSTFALLTHELSLIRDTPFAGVNYMWADLDGTTTRLVVLALDAASELATWAQAVGDVETCMIAVKAGLRVMPGHEELLEIQHSFISQRSMSSE